MKPTNGQYAFIGIIILIITVTACEFRVKKTNLEIIKQAEQLLENNPDRALHLLDSVQTGLLDQLDYARYQVIRTRTKDMAGFDITTDTTIFLARNYLVNHVDKYATMALYVAANVYNYQNKSFLSIRDFHQAIEYSKETDDNLKEAIYYNLARVYYKERFYNESLGCLRMSQQLDKFSKNIDNYELMGLNHIFLNNLDSALFYLNTALDMANSEKYNKVRIYRYMAQALQKASKYDNAKKKCFLALSLTDHNDYLQIGRLYLTLANIYNGTDQIDSAYVTAYQAKALLEKNEDVIDMIDLYHILYEIENKKGNTEKVISCRIKYEGYVFAKGYIDKTNMEAYQKQRDFAIIKQEEHNRVLIHTLMWRNILIIFVSISGIIWGILFFSWYRKRQKTRIKNTLCKVQEKYEGELEEGRLQIKELKAQYEDEISCIRTILNDERMSSFYNIEDLGELKKLMTEGPEKEIWKQIHKMLNRHTWEEIYPKIDKIHHNLYEHIKVDYPMLSDIEVKNCCLIIMGMGPLSISVVLDEDWETSPNRMTKIRKKLNMPPRCDIKPFLKGQYVKTDQKI